MSDLCVCMRDVISEFSSEIEGSLAFRALMLFLCSILCLMCSGSSLHVGCILPFGMFVCVENVCEDGICSVCAPVSATVSHPLMAWITGQVGLGVGS